MSNRTHQLVFGGVLVALLPIGVAIYYSLQSPVTPRVSKPTAQMAEDSIGPTKSPRMSAPKASVPPVVRLKAAVQSSDARRSERPPDWRRSDPVFHRYFELSTKVLRTTDETVEQQRLLADSTLAKRAFDLFANRSADPASRDQRIYGVDYITQALRWKENPNRKAVLESTVATLSTPFVKLVGQKASAETQQYAIGDRFELLFALATTEPSEISKVLVQTGPGQDRTIIGQALEFAVHRMKEIAAEAEKNKKAL